MRPVLAPVLLLLAALGACDTAPGTREPVGQPPQIAAFEATPLDVALATAAPFADVPLALGVTVAGADGEVTVRYAVRYQETDSLLAQGVVRGPAGRLNAAAALRLPRGAIGDYTITLATEDASGRPGDRASARLRFTATSLGPPAVTAIDAPATVTRPTTETGQAPLRIVATVTDPDGRLNIARVEIRNPGNPTPLAVLLDDGRTGGDQTARDGRYTTTLGITRAITPGAYTLEVVALDRAGLASAPAPVRFTVN